MEALRNGCNAFDPEYQPKFGKAVELIYFYQNYISSLHSRHEASLQEVLRRPGQQHPEHGAGLGGRQQICPRGLSRVLHAIPLRLEGLISIEKGTH